VSQLPLIFHGNFPWRNQGTPRGVFREFQLTSNTRKEETMEYSRNNAFSMKIDDPSIKEGDTVHWMIPIDGVLYAFFEDAIFEILSPESIDPDNRHPETRPAFQKCYSIGCKNSYVARTIIQAKEILQSVVLGNNLSEQIVLDHIWNCTKLLIICEAIHYDLYAQTLKLMPECDEIVEHGKNGGYIPSLPQIDNLDGKVAVFLGSAKRFLEKTHALLTVFYDSPSFDSNFLAYREWMKKNRQENDKVNKLLEDDKDWIKFIASLRNAHEINHAGEGNYVQIRNFELRAGNKFSSPSWKHDLSRQSGNKQEEYTDLILDMDVFLHNLCTFLEDIFLIGIEDTWDIRYKFQIWKKQETGIDKKCPTLYFIRANFI
jgi:hypothetical protein